VVAIRKLCVSSATVNVALRSSRGLLTTNLALFSGLLQLPIPLGMDLLLTPGEHVLRRDVANRTVQANVVVTR
jgi:hypothetical protein